MNIVALTPDRDHYIKPIETFLDYPLVFLRQPLWNELMSLKPRAVIFLGDWIYEYVQLIKKCRENCIPTILMMDGTIEWKHFFENPKWSYGGNASPYFPVNCDKVFVPGESTLRFLSFFGNQGKCEVTGFPRLDHYAKKRSITPSPKTKRRRIGVMSGNTAGYTESQIEESKRLFEDIYKWSELNNDITVLWRLRKGFENELDVEIVNDEAKELVDFLNKVDAVICQPSTAAYEAMLCGIPVAIADYNIAPNYMRAAWEIHSDLQIDTVNRDMLSANSLKLSLQEQILNDNLAFCGYSSQVCAQVINEMIKAAENCSSGECYYPSNISLEIVKKLDFPKISLEYSLFSKRTAYFFNEKTELEEAYTQLESLLDKKEFQLKRRTLGYWVEHFINKITKKI